MIFSTYLVPDVEMRCASDETNLTEHKPRIARDSSAYPESLQPWLLHLWRIARLIQSLINRSILLCYSKESTMSRLL